VGDQETDLSLCSWEASYQVTRPFLSRCSVVRSVEPSDGGHTGGITPCHASALSCYVALHNPAPEHVPDKYLTGSLSAYTIKKVRKRSSATTSLAEEKVSAHQQVGSFSRTVRTPSGVAEALQTINRKRSFHMRKIGQPRSVEEWELQLREDVLHQSRGQFRLLTREMVNSLAFRSLSKGGMVMVIAMMDKISYHRKGSHKQKGVTTERALLRNGGEFVVTANELIARGVSASSATRGRKEAWYKGFFDVLWYGTVHRPGRYRISWRWKKYPEGDYRPEGQSPPGMNVYPNSGRKFTRADGGAHHEVDEPPTQFERYPDHVN